MQRFTVKEILPYVVLIVLMYMPIFGFLDTFPIRIWDEARLAMNAYEMLNDKDFIVTHFNGQPDMWNTKPPLLIWIQVLFFKLFGISELSFRLPSAIAAFFTSMALLLFSKKYLNSFWFGFITIIVLITSHGYINVHASRTGDYDSLLTLFSTLSALSIFVFFEKKEYKYLYFFYLFTALAVLTKSIVGLMFLPAIFIYILIQKQLIPILKNKHFYIGLFGFLVLVVGYYLLREIKNPGYLTTVYNNELGGRYMNSIEGHKGDFWYYINNFIDFQLKTWYFLVPLGVIVGLLVKDKKINRITLFSTLIVVTFLLIISSAKTKLEWYDVPLYPFLSILIANFIYLIFRYLQNSKWINKYLKVNVIPFIFLFLIAFTPYQKIFNKTYQPEEYPWDKDFYEIGYFLKDAVKNKYDLNHTYLLYEGYDTQNLFYLKILNDKGVDVNFKNWKDLSAKDIVITHQNNIKKYLEENYEYEQIPIRGNIVKYKIYGKK